MTPKYGLTQHMIMCLSKIYQKPAIIPLLTGQALERRGLAEPAANGRWQITERGKQIADDEIFSEIPL